MNVDIRAQPIQDLGANSNTDLKNQYFNKAIIIFLYLKKKKLHIWQHMHQYQQICSI